MNKIQKFFFIILLALLSIFTAQDVTAKSLAIPPFTNRTGDNKYDWLSEALADMLTTDIAATKKIWIVNRLELKKIISEQQLTVSGLINDQSVVTIGNMVGAGLMMTGSYTIIGSQLRVDAQIFDVEKGVAQGAASVFGNIDEFFILEKKLAVKMLKELSIELPEDDKIRLFQIDSENIHAIENNYKGILALEKKDLKKAEDLFLKATKTDPYYKKAKENLNALTIDVKGNDLFGDALAALDKKKKQKMAIDRIYEKFVNEYYVFKLNEEKPRIETNINNKENVKIYFSFSIDVNMNAIENLIENLKKISEGDVELVYTASKIYQNPQKFKFYKENFSHFSESYYYSPGIGSFCWFQKSKYFQIKDNNKVLHQRRLTIGRTRGTDLSDPIIYCHIEYFDSKANKWRSKERNVKRVNTIIEISFEIPLKDVKRITKIELNDPPKLK